MTDTMLPDDRYLCPRRPVSRDDALLALRSGCYTVMEGVKKGQGPGADDRILPTIAIAEWFDFGRVDIQALAKQVDITKELEAADIPTPPPFPFTVFRYRLHNFTDPKGLEVEELLVIEWANMSKREAEACLRHPVQYDPPGLVAPMVHIRRFMFTHRGTVYMDRLCRFGPYTSTTTDAHAGFDTWAAYCGLWAVLNCKGIRKRVVEPETKLNKARQRSGKPPLQRVTYIDTEQFEAALAAPTRVGGHASPYMHLRRAHLWTLPNGTRKWRRHCIVNANKPGADRDHYDVKGHRDD
jgi:hypothetical protein